MRVTLDPLAADADGRIVLHGGTGALWSARLDWACRDAPLDVRVLSADPVALPDPEPSEAVPGALARILAAVRGQRALVLLANPAAALGAERIALAEGARLFAIASDADFACWDRALTLGVPAYGVRGTLGCDLFNPTPANALSALGFGVFTCEEGLTPDEFVEDPHGVRWRLPEAGSAAVIVRGGFEAQRVTGAAGEWRDTGSEAYVRLEFTTARGRCWTQPRFIAPRRSGHGG